jgi:hypothetical protein
MQCYLPTTLQVQCLPLHSLFLKWDLFALAYVRMNWHTYVRIKIATGTKFKSKNLNISQYLF